MAWHLAMACWAFAELLQDNYDVPKLIKLALIHDLGEIEAGVCRCYRSGRHYIEGFVWLIQQREKPDQIQFAALNRDIFRE